MMEERVAGWGGEAPYLNQGEQGLNGGSGGGQQASAAATVAGVPLRGEQGDGEVNNPCVSASLGQLRRRKPPPPQGMSFQRSPSKSLWPLPIRSVMAVGGDSRLSKLLVISSSTSSGALPASSPVAAATLTPSAPCDALL